MNRYDWGGLLAGFIVALLIFGCCYRFSGIPSAHQATIEAWKEMVRDTSATDR